jgi:hypothetical protein
MSGACGSTARASGHRRSRLRFGRWTRIITGRVLVAGGGRYSAGAELYDPATGRWTSTGSLRTRRLNHSATLLADGTVLVAGGSNSSRRLRSAELYDPPAGGGRVPLR